MSFTADVATFMEVLGPFYEYVADDLGLPNNNNKENNVNNGSDDSGIELMSKQDLNEIKEILGKFKDNHDNADDDDDHEQKHNDEDEIVIEKPREMLRSTSSTQFADVIDEDDDEDEDEVFQDAQDSVQASLHNAVQALNQDVKVLRNKINDLEKRIPSNWKNGNGFMSGLSPSTTAFILVWPFVAQALIVIGARLARKVS